MGQIGFVTVPHVAGPVEQLDVHTDGDRLLPVQRCLYCDAVIRADGEPDYPLPVGRFVVTGRDCPRHERA